MRKRMFAAWAACLLCGILLAGCGAKGEQSGAASGDATPSGDAVNVVCTTFPAYDWVCQIVGDNNDAVNVTYLMENGTDLHSYQPTVDDMAKISDCDLFVYVGGESDEWARDAAAGATNPNQHAVALLDAVGDAAVEEEVVEGMQADHDHEHEEGEEHEEDEEHAESEEHEEHDHDGEPEYDEHVWLSLRRAQTLVDALTAELSAVDAAHADAYAANAEAYKGELVALDEAYTAAVAAASHDTVVFADRFPFRYLVDDYGIKYYAAFVGCSAETEASFETVAFLADKVNELDLDSVLVIENSDEKIAQTVIQTAGGKDREILVMDSLQSTTADDIAGGKTYLDTMKSNLDVLKTALG